MLPRIWIVSRISTPAPPMSGLLLKTFNVPAARSPDEDTRPPPLFALPDRLGRVDELFDDNPRGHKMNECEKGLAQFLIPRGNAPKLFEVIKEPFYLLA